MNTGTAPWNLRGALDRAPSRIRPPNAGDLPNASRCLWGTSTSISTRCCGQTIDDGADARGAGQADADQATAGQY